MSSRDIYLRLDELRAAIHSIQAEPSTSAKLTHLTQSFNSLEATIHGYFDNSDDFGQRLEAEMARLLAPLNERLNRDS